MPRTIRASAADYCYHVLNRGNGRAEVFHKPADYDAFLEMVAAAQKRLPMRVLGYCLMPNHFHLVLRPHHDGDLSRWMQWLLTTHVRRYRRHYGSSGHVWQGRFKALPTMLKSTPCGGFKKRGWIDPIDHSDLLRPNLDSFHQRSNDL
ncbi:MAG TPA: transposase, partial [Isosphaeraceae bacterium]|nr:transposase [Isosphaeraceae bacterium]